MTTTSGELRLKGGAGELFGRTWQPDGGARAILAVCPGFNSHSGYYAWVGERCAAAGVATYAIDLRGRGRSPGERFYVERFADYVADFGVLVDHARAAHRGAPLFILGHSAGGVVACLYALDHGSGVTGLVCESFAFEVPPPDVALAILKGLSHIAPHAASIRLKNRDFSRDSRVVEEMDRDPLIAGEAQPLATMAALVRADEQLRVALSAITVPLLIIHGTADRAAKVSGSEQLFDRAASVDKMLSLYDGRLHDPLNDIGRQEVIGDILRWIGTRAPPLPISA